MQILGLQGGPFFGGSALDATDAAVAPKLYHCMVALKHFKARVQTCIPRPQPAPTLCSVVLMQFMCTHQTMELALTCKNRCVATPMLPCWWMCWSRQHAGIGALLAARLACTSKRSSERLLTLACMDVHAICCCCCLCLSLQGWELPSELAALHQYMAAVQALPEWRATDYGHEAILAGWTRHMKHAH